MFGSDALDIIAEHPEQLTAIRGLNEEKANASSGIPPANLLRGKW